jgi:hypothetical protein
MHRWRRRSVHHWGRYAVVCVLTLVVTVPLMNSRGGGWAFAGLLVWMALMQWLYEVWVRKD